MNMKEMLGSAFVLLLVVTGGVYLGSSLVSTKAGFLTGGVSVSDDYIATSTKSITGVTLTDRTLRAAGGSIGEITITGAAAGQITLCNATTSDVTQRASALATSSLNCINIPASTAAGTYTFNTYFDTGIMLDTDAVAPTSTINIR